MARRKVRQSKPSEAAVIAAVAVMAIAVVSAGFFVSYGYSIISYSVCGNGVCESDETPGTCPRDCGGCGGGGGQGQGACCGNGICESVENRCSCPEDCGTPPSPCPGCGNGIRESSEVCDGNDLGGENCTHKGFAGGTLKCTVDCTFDTSSCTAAKCGNDKAEGTEVCDGTDLAGENCTHKGFTGGTLECNATCSGYDTSGCTVVMCGNGQIEGMEMCDGTDLAGATCIDQGFTGGTLKCKADCSDYNTSSCTAGPAGPTTQVCGDSVAETGEECDGTDMNGATCLSQGFIGGKLACADDCTFDTSGCTAAPTAQCGNGKLEEGEDCDGTKLDGQTCADMGFTGGKLACADDCTFDTSNCTSAPVATAVDANEAIMKAQQDIITAQGEGKNITDATLKVNQAIAAANTGDYATAKTKAEAASLAAQTATAPQGFPVAMIGVAVVIIGVGAAIAYYLLKVNPDALKNFGKKEPAPAPAPAPTERLRSYFK